MALYTKSILKPIEASDGLRISVMSRHTLNDGKTPHPEIIPHESYTYHFRTLAPPMNLVSRYYHNGLSWEDFEKEYNLHLQNPVIAHCVRVLAGNSMNRDITILCIEEKPDRCHRRLLAEECKRHFPKLIVEHR